MKHSAKRSVKKSYKKSHKKSHKKSGGKFHKGPRFNRNTSASTKVLDEYLDGKLTLAKTIQELQEIYSPSKLNLKFKKDVLEKLKKGELQKEEAERKLHMFFRLPREFIPKNNSNKKPNNKVNNKKQSNN